MTSLVDSTVNAVVSDDTKPPSKPRNSFINFCMTLIIESSNIPNQSSNNVQNNNDGWDTGWDDFEIESSTSPQTSNSNANIGVRKSSISSGTNQGSMKIVSSSTSSQKLMNELTNETGGFGSVTSPKTVDLSKFQQPLSNNKNDGWGNDDFNDDWGSFDDENNKKVNDGAVDHNLNIQKKREERRLKNELLKQQRKNMNK